MHYGQLPEDAGAAGRPETAGKTARPEDAGRRGCAPSAGAKCGRGRGCALRTCDTGHVHTSGLASIVIERILFHACQCGVRTCFAYVMSQGTPRRLAQTPKLQRMHTLGLGSAPTQNSEGILGRLRAVDPN